MAAFGVRDVCEVVLKSLRDIPACRSLTGKDLSAGEPVVYFDSLKVSTLSGTSTTVYATGGSGNSRRLAWDGDKEVTFHIEDALLTPESFAIMSAAKLRKREVAKVEVPVTGNINYAPGASGTAGINTITTGFDETEKARFISLYSVTINNTPQIIESADVSFNRETGIITVKGPDYSAASTMTYTQLSDKPVKVHVVNNTYIETAGEAIIDFVPIEDPRYPMFIFPLNVDGDRGPKITSGTSITNVNGVVKVANAAFLVGVTYLIDAYKEVLGAMDSLVLTADATSDYYKLEGETIFVRETDGEPLGAHLTIFKVKPRTTFEIAMSPTGDPSVFSMDFDAFPQKGIPGYEKCKNGIIMTLDIELDSTDECDCTWQV